MKKMKKMKKMNKKTKMKKMNKIFKILIFLLFIFSVNFCFASIQDKVGYLICVSVNKDTPKQDISKLIKEYNVKSFNLVGS